MKKILITITALLSCCLCSALLGMSWAAESSGERTLSNDVKEKYRQEILGQKSAPSTDKEYVIGYRDMIYVEVYGEGSMAIGPSSPATTPPTAEVSAAQDGVRGRGTGSEVGADGRVSLRHIGDVYVVGMTLTQLADYLKKLYNSVYEDPTIITTLLQSNSRQYTMMGQVKSPGLFHLDFPTNVVKAVAKAGGFTEWANDKITIIRQGNELVVEKGKEQTQKKIEKFEFDYDDFLKGRHVENNVLLEPGDVVVIH